MQGWRVWALGLLGASPAAAAPASSAPVAFDAACQRVAAGPVDDAAWAAALAQVAPADGWAGWTRRDAPDVLAALQGVWRRSDGVITKTLVGDEERVTGTTGQYAAKLRAYRLTRGAQRHLAMAWRFKGRSGAYLLAYGQEVLLEFGGRAGAPSDAPTGRFARVGPAPSAACDQAFAVERDVRAARARQAFVRLWPALVPGDDASRRGLIEFLGAHRAAVRVGDRAEVVAFPEVQVARTLLRTFGDEDAPRARRAPKAAASAAPVSPVPAKAAPGQAPGSAAPPRAARG